MMRAKNSIIIFLLAIPWSHIQCQTPNAIRQIEYTTLTRGYQKQVIISPDSIKATVEGRQAEGGQSFKRKLNKDEWKTLIGYLKGLTLAEIPKLESPTMKRTYDGARHSSLTLLTNDGQSFSHSFDDENPDPKLQPLMKAITGIVQTGR